MNKDTISVHGWYDLQQFGIGMLTGEADRLSMRLLCDVNAEGREILLDYLGLPEDTILAPSWNSSVNQAPAIGSVMLHRDSLFQVAEFAMFRQGALASIKMASELMGVFNVERLAQYEELAHSARHSSIKVEIRRNYAIGNTAPGFGTRNTHAMTGRTL